MTFATPPPSLSLSSECPARLLSPTEEMQLYCGLANPESTEASHMELEQENPSQKHRREDTTDDRPPSIPSPSRELEKGRDIPKHALSLVPTLAPRHIVSRLSPPAIKSFNYCDR